MLGYCACYWINMLAHVKKRFMYQRRVAAKKLNPQKWEKCFPQRNSPLAMNLFKRDGKWNGKIEALL